ncbi:MAG: glycosyl hydrolase family 28-related protein, partial [Allosphingosinicella sp.]
MTTPSSDVTFAQSGTGAVTRTVESRLRDTVSVMDFGAVADGTTDDQPAIQAAIDFLCGEGGGILFFPPGVYYCDSELGWDSAPVTLQGSGTSVQPAVGTVLQFPAGLGGAVRIQNGTAALGGFSQVRDLVIRGSGTSAVSSTDAATGIGAGLVIQASEVRVERVTVQQFEGNGCMILSHLSTPTTSLNANNCLLIGLACYNNLRSGLAIAGVDSNACSIVKLDSSANAEFGVYENSILGNVYVGAHFAGNGTAPIRIGAVSGYNRFYGCYKEVGTQLVVQLDSGGAGQNEIDFNLADGDGVSGHPLLVTDNTASQNNEIKLQNVRRRAAFGGDGGNGTFIISPDTLLIREGKQVQMQNAGTTANWFFSVSSGGDLVFSSASNAIALPASRPNVVGSRGGNVALDSLLSALATMGLITN